MLDLLVLYFEELLFAVFTAKGPKENTLYKQDKNLRAVPASWWAPVYGEWGTWMAEWTPE